MNSLYEQFLSHFRQGVMKPNKYEIYFTLPAGVNSSFNFVHPVARNGVVRAKDFLMNSTGSINIKCHTALFPQRTLATAERLQNSSPFRVPYSSNYDPITLSFYADGTADTRRYFDVWQNIVINVDSNTLNFYDEFTSDIFIWNLDDAGRRTYGIQCIEAYPLAVGASDISYSNQNNFQNVTVTLNYRRWKSLVL